MTSQYRIQREAKNHSRQVARVRNVMVREIQGLMKYEEITLSMCNKQGKRSQIKTPTHRETMSFKDVDFLLNLETKLKSSKIKDILEILNIVEKKSSTCLFEKAMEHLERYAPEELDYYIYYRSMILEDYKKYRKENEFLKSCEK